MCSPRPAPVQPRLQAATAAHAGMDTEGRCSYPGAPPRLLWIGLQARGHHFPAEISWIPSTHIHTPNFEHIVDWLCPWHDPDAETPTGTSTTERHRLAFRKAVTETMQTPKRVPRRTSSGPVEPVGTRVKSHPRLRRCCGKGCHRKRTRVGRGDAAPLMVAPSPPTPTFPAGSPRQMGRSRPALCSPDCRQPGRAPPPSCPTPPAPPMPLDTEGRCYPPGGPLDLFGSACKREATASRLKEAGIQHRGLAVLGCAPRFPGQVWVPPRPSTLGSATVFGVATLAPTTKKAATGSVCLRQDVP